MHAAIADKKAQLAEVCRRYGVTRLEVFGSAARGADFDPATSDDAMRVEAGGEESAARGFTGGRPGGFCVTGITETRRGVGPARLPLRRDFQVTPGSTEVNRQERQALAAGRPGDAEIEAWFITSIYDSIHRKVHA